MERGKESQLSGGLGVSKVAGAVQGPDKSRMRWRVGAGLALASGAGLRLWMMRAIPQVEGDTLLYGNLAKNILLHGRFAMADGSGVLHETLIRLPGYPLFLATCFRIFGVENYNAVIWVQIAMELAGCLLLAGFAERIAGERLGKIAWQATLWLGALCPFTASYTVAPLTETATLFSIALALWSMSRFLAKPAWVSALSFTFAVSFAALLRPDGALVGVALLPGLLLGLKGTWVPKRQLVLVGTVCALLAVLPFAVWANRNWKVFHVFEPLAPRYATDPGEAVDPGWQLWMKTWCLDFVSTYEIYWNVPDGPFDVNKLPARAFDTPAERAETEKLAAAYDNNGQDLSPAIDGGFARLAEERVKADPLRFYLWLPLGRVSDMWLRPRVENLNIDLDWWVYAHHNNETIFSWSYAALNAFYLVLGVVGLWMRPKCWLWMLLYMVLRSALLMTLEAPEARYTLECFPMLFALGGVGIARALMVRKRQ
jgi:multisubunit Na+/H+ antiporter MnhB subunit